MADHPLEARIAELESTIESQQAHIEEVEATNDALETRVETLEEETQSLKAQVVDLEATVEDLQAEKSALETEVAGLKAEADAREAHIRELQTDQAALESQVAELQAETDSLRTELAAVDNENDQLHERLAQLEAQPEIEVADENDPIGSLYIAGAPVGQAIKSKPGQSDLDAELDALREELEAFADTEAADEPAEPTVEAQTPLEQIVALPQAVVDDQLTANQRRARFVAKDITEYASKTPAGWVLTPKDLRTVLNAAFDTGHSETCRRVRTILADLGDEDVAIKDSRGEKKLVVDPPLVGRLQEIEQADHDVVSPSEV